jgi:hypothetical protein
MSSKRFISILLVLALIAAPWVAGVHRVSADDASVNSASPNMTPTPKAMKDCKDQLPKYLIPDPSNAGSYIVDSSSIDLTKPYSGQTELDFRIAFEKAGNQYHAYVECVFEGVVTEILGSSGSKTDGIFGAHAPNMPEWSKPEAACQETGALKKVLTDGDPATLVGPMLDNYNLYVSYLQALYDAEINLSPSQDATGTTRFEEAYTKNQSLKQVVENEVQDSLAAMDTAFTGLKDMRQAYTMHVQFQCMLKNLEFYRRAMENLRKVIMALPSVVINASMSK